MAYASQSGRARTNAANPQAHAICDRCGFRYNWVDLQWQFDWRGATMQNIKILVCKTCIDKPQEQLRAIVVPADPTPIVNARTQDFTAAETNYRTAANGSQTDFFTGLPKPSTTVIQTQSGQNQTTIPLGIPSDLDPDAIMPLSGTTHYAVAVPFLSVLSNGTNTITVTCSAAHGLSTNAQISVSGLLKADATGTFSVTVTSPTVFTYLTYSPVASGSLVTNGTRIVTANIGLPLDYTQIPQTGR
jgi:hypothetical protein